MEFRYGIGNVIDAVIEQDIPEGFQMISIPAFTWAIFKCVGPMPDAIQTMWDNIYREWIPGADYELISEYDIEYYFAGDTSAEDYVSGIWLSVKIKD